MVTWHIRFVFICLFHGNIDPMLFNFYLGTPFSPYEQLMGVLPLASKDNIPSTYHVCIVLILFNPSINMILWQDLMYDLNSPIINFYLLDFEFNLNERKKRLGSYCQDPTY